MVQAKLLKLKEGKRDTSLVCLPFGYFCCVSTQNQEDFGSKYSRGSNLRPTQTWIGTWMICMNYRKCSFLQVYSYIKIKHYFPQLERFFSYWQKKNLIWGNCRKWEYGRWLGPCDSLSSDYSNLDSKFSHILLNRKYANPVYQKIFWVYSLNFFFLPQISSIPWLVPPCVKYVLHFFDRKTPKCSLGMKNDHKLLN